MREIIIIKTNNGEELKNLLNQGKINYSIIYDDILTDNEEEIWRRDVLLANKDKARNKEIGEWNKISKVKDKQGW